MIVSSRLLGLEALLGEVADHGAEVCLHHAGNAVRIDEAVAALRRLGRHVLRQLRDDIASDPDGVFHLAVGEARMDRHAFDRDLNRIGREALVLDRAGGLAVHRIAEIGAELLEIDLVDPAADLLVGGEEDADRAVPTSGLLIKNSAAAMISAMPALSSAPSSVVPSEVTMSWPTRSFSTG